jgi:membrane protein YdbS with pleckstrin-like domain
MENSNNQERNPRLRSAKEWLSLIFVIVVGAVIITAISSLGAPKGSFVSGLVHAFVALVVIGVTMTLTIVGICRFGEKRGFGESTGLIATGWLVGLFITTPITLTLAFSMLRAIGIR